MPDKDEVTTESPEASTEENSQRETASPWVFIPLDVDIRGNIKVHYGPYLKLP